MCEMHYYRVRRNGTTKLQELTRQERRIHTGGYVLVYDKHHPLSDKGGYVYEHRKVLYDASPEMICFHCGNAETWGSCHVDHLDDSKTNNNLSNLVISCPQCNQARGMIKMAETMRAKHRKHTHAGITLCISEWADRLGITHQSVIWRLKHWKNREDIFTKARGVTGPIGKRRSRFCAA